MSKIELKNDKISISILKPGTEYTRSRFDWSGIVEQITLGETTFLGQESFGDNIGTEGIGLSTEFGINTSIGYDEVAVGEEFLKIGIGAQIREKEKDYFFFDEYKNRAFPIKYKEHKNRVDFFQSGALNGYAYDYKKTISIKENSLTISCTLHNTGSKAIKTEEYCHNFFRPGDIDISKNTMVKLSHRYKELEKVGDINHERESLTFSKDPTETFYIKGELTDKPKDFSWRMSNKMNGVAVECYEDFQQSIFACWGMPYVISPETFFQVDLKPGEETSWNRKYLFFV